MTGALALALAVALAACTVLAVRLRRTRTELEAANRRTAAVERERDVARAELAAVPPPPPPPDPSPAWDLLLARVERQWAESVGAQPDERGVVDGDPAAQLAQAVRRELERLREEVGVDAEVVIESLDPVDGPATFLAIGEVAARLAAHAEVVRVELGTPVVVLGDGWDGDDAGLAALGAVERDGERVRVVLA